jgi:exodeoxyribonuclease V alpha subunit
LGRNPRPTGPLERWEGSVERFTYRDPETGFAVVRFRPSGQEAISAVGSIAHLVEGQQVRLSGRRIDHPRFGPQIGVEEAEVATPATVDGIRAYLSSKLVKGVGPATADRIVERFGADTLRVIEEEPERLAEVGGLGKKRIEQLTEAIQAQRDVQDVMVFLRGHGLGPALATRIVRRLGKGAIGRIQADPYRLVDDVIGVGFRTADGLARSLGIASDSPERIRAGLQFALEQAASREGHCFLPEEELVDRTAELLAVERDLVGAELLRLDRDRRVLIEPAADEGSEARVYPTALHRAECGVAGLVDQLLAEGSKPLPIQAEKAVAWFAERAGFALPEGQERALLTSLTEPLTVVTGGPGVGKTTIVRGLVEILRAKGLRVALAAPTGRAAKRLEESTGLGAKTIHRLLEFHPGTNSFQRNEELPIEADLIVVDEVSMLDVRLAHDLLRAVAPGTRLVLVGDVTSFRRSGRARSSPT